MIYIADSNILISALIQPSGIVGDIVLRKLPALELSAPHYLLTEVQSKKAKIIKATGYKQDEFLELLFILVKRIEFLDEEIIPDQIWQHAYALTKDIDEKDTPYVALALFTNRKLWTGDKKLVKGLRKKFFELLIETHELSRLLQ